MIRLEMLGRVPSAQAKRAALLAYLTLARPRGEHRRDTLLALLWPELSAGRARAALRQALHALRKEVEAGVLCSNGTEGIGVDPAHLACDVWELDSAAAHGDHDRVLALFQGELLAGLFVSDAPAFEHWLDAERSRVRDVVRRSAWLAADEALVAGDAGRVVTIVRFAVGLSTFDETAIRRAMQLLASAGERAAAIALYERFAAEMLAELGAEPSGATRGVAEALRCTRDEAIAPAPVADPPARTRTSTTRRAPRAVLTAGVVLVAITAAAGIAGSVPGAMDPRRIRVDAFENASGMPALDTLAAVAATRVRDELLHVDQAQLVSRAATDDRAGTVVRGSLRHQSGEFQFHGEVVDRSTGTVLRSVSLASRDADWLVAAAADRLNAAVATALYPGWGTAVSQPPTYAGYRLFLDGMRSVKRERHDSAVAAFTRAFGADSSFTMAGLLAATELYQLKRYASAESLAVAIARHRAELPAVDARLLEWIELSLRGDRIGARGAMRAITQLVPSSDLAWLQLAIDNVETGRPADALDALDHIDRDAAFGDAWPSYWATRAEALHIAGDHEHELAVVRDGLRRHPEMRVLENYELRALAALGRVHDVEEGVRALASAPGSGGVDRATTMRQVAQELAAHGQPAAARAMYDRVRELYASASRRDSVPLATQVGLASTLFLADDRAGARAAFEALRRQYPHCLDCNGALAVLAARDGDRAFADSVASRLARARGPYLFGRQYLWQARIVAALGRVPEASRILNTAFDAGSEFDVLTHADPDLRRLRPDSIYRVFARAADR